MSSNASLVCQKYSDAAYEDGRAESSRASSIEFHYTEKFLRPYIRPDSRVAELGCATGYYAFRFAPLCKSYLGVDLSPTNIALFREKIQASGLSNAQAEVGDATKLALLDRQFDVVLALGPMYHLPEGERALVFAECRRICKPGGTLAFAYINKGGAYMKACIDFPDAYPSPAATEPVLEKGEDDLRPGLFYFTTPEEMAADAERCGLTVLENHGLDFTYGAARINEMDEEKFAAWMALSDLLCETPSCTGMSNHALLICRK